MTIWDKLHGLMLVTGCRRLNCCNSSDRYLHFAANIVRQHGGCKQKSIAKDDFSWIFVRNSEGI